MRCSGTTWLILTFRLLHALHRTGLDSSKLSSLDIDDRVMAEVDVVFGRTG